jgi:HEAT repeats
MGVTTMKITSRCIIGAFGGILLVLIAMVTTRSVMVWQPWRTQQPPAAVQASVPEANPQVERPQDIVNLFNQVQERIGRPVELSPVNQPVGPARAEDSADPLSRAISQLSSDDVSSQEAACKLLAAKMVNGQRRAEVVQAVKKMIDARAKLTPRPQGVRVLAVWGTAADVPYLLRLLDDPDGGVEEAAIVALGKIKDPSAADILALRLYSPQRAAASEALKEIGPAAEGVVRQQLNSTDNNVRLEAIKVIKVIGTAASQKDLIVLAGDDDPAVALAAREALPPKLRPPNWGPKQIVTLNVHVADYQAWPAIEAQIEALSDSPQPKCKSNRSGEYMWVTLSPVNVDLDTFARKIKFGKVIAVHTDQRLIYVESGR